MIEKSLQLSIFNRSITKLHNHSMTCDSKPIIGILKFRWNARSRRAASYFDVMPPGAPARGPAHRLHRTLLRPLRIPLWRISVEIRVVPIAAPLVHVIANVVKSERIWIILRNRFGPVLPPCSVVRQGLRRGISPGKLFLLLPTAHGTFPFGLCR